LASSFSNNFGKKERKKENITELALGKTLLKLHYNLQVFCVRHEDGEGVNRGS